MVKGEVRSENQHGISTTDQFLEKSKMKVEGLEIHSLRSMPLKSLYRNSWILILHFEDYCPKLYISNQIRWPNAFS